MADDSLKDFIAEQLRNLPELQVRKMFGGHGLYQGDQFFGILVGGKLYFKTDQQTRAAYTRRGMKAFMYEKGRPLTSKSYFEVPADVLEQAETLVDWATLAIAAAGRAV